ncbi:neuronal acetylcholine receptor subunit alpha-7-like [Ostrea edulis]|uniref:neuronal acetylcholine receptor subunit alpha-7-like n=1 Tax=Ostrea edulis TaxID=37623 RepID=UPI0024AFDC83|nr:neuronal acetylcholine receptor subunit alpha-7-like [Ostrea edulis]
MGLLFFLCFVFVRFQILLCVSNIEEYLFKNYSSMLKPRRIQSEPVNVSIDMTIMSVHEVDEQFQYISFYAWFNIQWYDDFLTWNENEHAGIKTIAVPYQKAWIPDLSMWYSEEHLHDLGPHSFVSVTSDGHLVWFTGGKYVVVCDLKMKKFPFDEQKCIITISAWQSTDSIQKLVPRKRLYNDAEFIAENGEWEFTNFTFHSFYQKEFDTTVLEYTLCLKRRYLHFVLSTLVPIMILSILNSLTFFIPLESGERIQYSLTLFLAFTVFLTLFEQMMPQNSTDVPYISVYVGFQLILCVISTVVSVVCTSKKYSSEMKEAKYCNNTGYCKQERRSQTISTKISEGKVMGKETKLKNKLNNINDNTHNICAVNSFQHRTNLIMILLNSFSLILSTAILFILYWI